MLTGVPFEAERALMLETLRDAGLILGQFFGQECGVREKGPLDLVTEADFAVEQFIKERIRSVFPDDAITAEESGAEGTGGRRWTIDPLDGTVNFAHGIPLFGVCLGFADEVRPRVGGVLNPISRECFTAVDGEGALLNGLPISCSGVARSADAHVFINPHGLRRPGHAEKLIEVYRRTGRSVQGILNLGSMSMALCWLAAGRLDAAIALDVDPYSTPACSVVLREAGVRITDFRSEPYTPASRTLLAANPALHAQMITLFQGLDRGTG